MENSNIDQLCINTIRFLSIDAVQKANSGHPGAPMGMAPMAYTLWTKALKHNPKNPKWFDRDRFILSAGHASMLLYSLLHLSGYDLSLEEIKNFRQWDSKTAGHPEYRHTPGVEVTTGPLGQGFANGIGMAIAEKWLSSKFNKDNYSIVDHYTYGIVSDGDLMEGVSSEAASLAGHLGLGKVIYLYDDNNISIEGSTELAFTESIAKRFLAYNWHVIDSVDGNDVNAIENAIKNAQNETSKPSLIICKTTIGEGSPNKAGKASAHGEPLGKDEVILTRENLGWEYSEPFYIPPKVSEHMGSAVTRGKESEDKWQTLFASYKSAYPDDAELFDNIMNDILPKGWDEELSSLFDSQEKPLASREASGIVLNALSDKFCNLCGGSADLAPSNKTELNGKSFFSKSDPSGQNLHFGVREHAMGSISNGLALHGGILPYVATFLVFYDYMRPAVRLSALMGLKVIYIYTHDSIGLGEDGPTHQPIEHLFGLRSVPNLTLIRPCDTLETLEAYKHAIVSKNTPIALSLTRQKLPILDRNIYGSAGGLQKGAYVLWQSSSDYKVILIGTGSEAHIALEAGKMLENQGIAARVVSMPSWELFEEQSKEYKDSVLDPSIQTRVSIEAGSTLGWCKYLGCNGFALGIDTFGASAPADILYEKYGITSENVVLKAKELLSREV